MKEINHHIWDLQYEANQDKGYKDTINFKDAFLNEIFVRKGIVHASLFMNPRFSSEAFKLSINNFWLKGDENLTEQNFIASFSSAPLDEISLQNTISKEYVDLFKSTNMPFTFSIIHLLPLPLKNNDKDTTWTKKVGDNEIKRKLDTWLTNKNQIYLQNTLTNFTERTLNENNITNNFDKPLFLISNIEFDQFNQIKVIDSINVFVGLIDNANRSFKWIKATRNLFMKKNRYQFHFIPALNPLDFDIDFIKESRNIKLEYNSFTLYHQYEKTPYYNLFAIYRDYTFFGTLNQWTLNRDAIWINENKKLPEYITRIHDFLFKWTKKVEEK